MGGVKNDLETLVRETLDCCEQCLINNASQSSEDHNADSHVDSKRPGLGCFSWKLGLHWSWNRGYIYHILAENLFTVVR